MLSHCYCYLVFVHHVLLLLLFLLFVLRVLLLVPGLRQDAIPHDGTARHVQNLPVHGHDGKVNRTRGHPKRPPFLQRRQRVSLHFLRPTRDGEGVRQRLRPGEEARHHHRSERRLVQENFRRERFKVRRRHRTRYGRPFFTQIYVPDVLQRSVKRQVEQRLSRRSIVVVFIASFFFFFPWCPFGKRFSPFLQRLRDAIADDA